jgi:hypothetical protein
MIRYETGRSGRGPVGVRRSGGRAVGRSGSGGRGRAVGVGQIGADRGDLELSDLELNDLS